MLMKAEKSVFEINAGIERKLRVQRKAAWEKLNQDRRRELVRNTVWPGVATVARSWKQPSNRSLATAATKTIGTIQRDGYRIEKIILAGRDRVKIEHPVNASGG